MPQTFTGQYFSQLNYGSTTITGSLATAILTDADLIRGDDATESVSASNGFRLFDGIQRVDFSLGRIITVSDGEAVTSVTFTDGTTIFGVNSLYDQQNGPYGEIRQQFLLDTAALAAVGKTLADVANVRVLAEVDHGLNWDDFGFVASESTGGGSAPALNLVQGTAGADRLTGTAGNDLIRGGAGDDRLTGGAGTDSFVFGSDAGNGVRNRDVITDFNAATDTIVFEAGATIRLIEERNGDLFIQLNGDRDSITIRNADLSIVEDFVFVDTLFA